MKLDPVPEHTDVELGRSAHSDRDRMKHIHFSKRKDPEDPSSPEYWFPLPEDDHSHHKHRDPLPENDRPHHKKHWTPPDEESQSPIPSPRKHRRHDEEHERMESVRKTSIMRDYIWERGFKPVLLFLVAMGFVWISFNYCIYCFWGILLLSLCTCIGAPLMNIPLWISVIVLVWYGGVIKLQFSV